MNNQHASQKDKVSFGVPFGEWFKQKRDEYISGTFLAVCKAIRDKNPEAYDRSDSCFYIPKQVLEEADQNTPELIKKGNRIVNSAVDIYKINEASSKLVDEGLEDMKNGNWDGFVKGISKVVGAPAAKITTTIKEVSKDISDRPSSPREKKARLVVDTYTAASGLTGTAAGFVPIVPVEEVLQIAPEQREAMVNEIADIYNLDNSDKYILGKRLGMKWHNKLEPKIIDGTMMGIELGTEYLKDNATNMLVQETATELSDAIPYLKPAVKGVTKTVNAKLLGEKAIKECKRLAKRH